MSENLPEQQNSSSNQDSVVHRMQIQQSFSGPLPPPEILKKFDEVVPGAAERIIKMAEEQFTHRTSLERKVIDSNIIRSGRGQIFGFVIAIFGLIIAGVVSVYGNQWAGGAIGIGSLASLVGVFMYGMSTRNKEIQDKRLKDSN